MCLFCYDSLLTPIQHASIQAQLAQRVTRLDAEYESRVFHFSKFWVRDVWENFMGPRGLKVPPLLLIPPWRKRDFRTRPIVIPYETLNTNFKFFLLECSNPRRFNYDSAIPSYDRVLLWCPHKLAECLFEKRLNSMLFTSDILAWHVEKRVSPRRWPWDCNKL